MSEKVLNQLRCHSQETALLESAAELLGWDERTKMPPAAGPYRAEQIAYLSGIIHRRKTDERVGEWLEELSGTALATDVHSDAGATIRQMKREYDKAVKLPPELVEELSRTAVLGQQTWAEARKNNDFAAFQPVLTRIVGLVRQKAAAMGYEDCPYDALLDDFEPGETTRNVNGVLCALRQELVPLVAAIGDSDRRPPDEILRRAFPVSAQESFGRTAATAIGFDFRSGRLDVTDHPFCAGMGPHDCRITTRYDEHFFPSAFFGTLHEAGHGLYDQGLRADQFGLPPGSFVSLGIHESQSRMWENLVGRSLAFWKHFFPQAQRTFTAALNGVTLDEFYFAINAVRPSLIRVEADEATYNLHIVIRFELEQALINDEFAISELPGAWNEKYEKYLGMAPPTDAVGVLQDVHWSAALLGYFPTYSLGNLYASQFFAQAEKDIGDLSEQFARGEFESLLGWLRRQIHQHGQAYTASELVQQVTGKPLSHEPLLAHMRNKFRPLYGLQ